MKVTLDKEDLTNLVCGISPDYDEMARVPRGLGELRASYDRWEWNRNEFQKYTAEEILDIYQNITRKYTLVDEYSLTVRVCLTSSGREFPYGHLKGAEAMFITNNVGNTFKAKRYNMNYYKLDNGFMVHIYNAMEL